jgi:ankyrin repeat protein
MKYARSDMFCRTGRTALKRAVKERHKSIVRLLLEHEADVNAADM